MKITFGLCILFLSVFTFCQNRRKENKVDEKLIDSLTKRGFLVDPTEASYPGGYDSLRSFIKKNLKYPLEDVEGRVYVKFMINVDGSVTDFKVIKGLCKKCDQNAIDVLKKMPKWIPAKANGIPIKTKMILPVKFF